MRDIQNILYEKMNNDKYGNLLLQYATILIYISVGHGILELLPMPSIVNTILAYTSRIVYYGYMIGLIGCFAKKEFLPMTIVFMLNTVTSVISCIRWHTFTSVLNILVYGVLSYFTFTYITKNNAVVNINANNTRFCPNCGQGVTECTEFCKSCGSKII